MRSTQKYATFQVASEPAMKIQVEPIPFEPRDDSVTYNANVVEPLQGSTWMGSQIYVTESAIMAASSARDWIFGITPTSKRSFRRYFHVYANLAWLAAGILPIWTETPHAPPVIPFDFLTWAGKGWRHSGRRPKPPDITLILDTRGPDHGLDGLVIASCYEQKP
jgi:hypothetical protein